VEEFYERSDRVLVNADPLTGLEEYALEADLVPNLRRGKSTIIRGKRNSYRKNCAQLISGARATGAHAIADNPTASQPLNTMEAGISSHVWSLEELGV
jgi:hypothetical protein